MQILLSQANNYKLVNVGVYSVLLHTHLSSNKLECMGSALVYFPGISTQCEQKLDLPD